MVKLTFAAHETCNSLLATCNIFIVIFNNTLQIVFEECDKHTYGFTCSQICGNCYDEKQCDHVNGSCTQGCEAGMFGEKCDEGRKNILPSDISKIHSIYFILYSILIIS